jgi:CPA2 family monovalent cation:H+ antiporter-2
MFRNLSRESSSLADLNLQIPDIEISTLRLVENSPLVGKSLAEIELRKKHGVTILAIRRDSKVLSNLDVNMPFCADDVLFVLGPPDKVAGVAASAKNPEKGEA